jgi:hypothetical protein
MNTMMYGADAADASQESKAIVPAGQQHMGLLQTAAASGNVELFRETMKAQVEWETYQAKKEFAAAMARAKADLPIISKTSTVDFTSTKGRVYYRYADLAEVVAAVNPILSREGIFFHHDSSNTATHATVTCVLEGHGHREASNTITAPHDASGAKNPAQAIRSTITLLKRTTLESALGVATSDDDDDGRGGQDRGSRRPPSASGSRQEPEDVEVREVQEGASDAAPAAQQEGPREITGSGAKDWVAKYIAGIKTAKDGKELAQWATVNATHLATLTTKYPDLRAQVDEVFNDLLAREKPSNGKKTTRRAPPSAKGGADMVVDSDQWRKDMEGALSGCTAIEEVEKVRGEIDHAPDGILQEHLKAVHAVYQQTVDRIVLKK